MLNLAILLDDSAREAPERSAVVCEGSRLPYAQLHAAANQVANGLVQAGIQKGDKVDLSCQDMPSFVIAYFAFPFSDDAGCIKGCFRRAGATRSVIIISGGGMALFHLTWYSKYSDYSISLARSKSR